MSGELSKFIIQMKYEDELKPDFIDLSIIVKTTLAYQESIERTDGHSKQLAELYLNRNKIRSLSPSAINTWLSCRMRFYYQYVNRLKEPDSVSADIDPAMLGNILHDIMKNLYLPYTGSEISSEMLNLILKNREFLAGAIDSAVNEQFKAGRHDIASGNELLVREVLRVYVDKILKSDRTIAPFVILNLEDSVVFNFPFFLNGSPVEISMGGKVDRVDNISGVTRIVDYKTGVVSESIGALEELFQDDRKKDGDGWLQTLLYCEAYLSQKQSGTVRPSIYSVRKMNGSALSDKLKIKSKSSGETVIDDYETIRTEFIDRLRDLISIIFNGNEPFVKTKNARTKCVWCPYRILCSR
jgi:Leucine-rich repeat (LRR) protein